MKYIHSFILTILVTLSQAADSTAHADEHLLLALNAIDSGNTPLAMGHIRVCINTLTMIHAQVSPEVSKTIDNRMKTVTGHKRAAYLNVKAIEYMSHSENVLKAEPLLREAIQLDPSLPESYNSLSYIEMSQLKMAKTKDEWHIKADTVMTLLNKAIELNPKYVDAYYNRGNMFNAMGKTAEAERDFLTRNSIVNNVPIHQPKK